MDNESKRRTVKVMIVLNTEEAAMADSLRGSIPLATFARDRLVRELTREAKGGEGSRG